MDSEENSFPSAFRYRAMEESEVVDSQMQDQNSEEHEDVEISENNEENLCKIYYFYLNLKWQVSYFNCT